MYAEIQKQKNVPLAGTIDGASDVNIRHVFGLEVTPLSCLPTGAAAVRRAARLTTAGNINNPQHMSRSGSRSHTRSTESIRGMVPLSVSPSTPSVVNLQSALVLQYTCI